MKHKFKIFSNNKSGLTLVELVVCSVLVVIVTLAVANSFYTASRSFAQSRNKFELLSQTKNVENVLRGSCLSGSLFSTTYISYANSTFEFESGGLKITTRSSSANPYVTFTLDKIKSIRLVTNPAGSKSRLDYEIVAADKKDHEYRLSGGIIVNNVSSLNLNTTLSSENNPTFYIK